MLTAWSDTEPGGVAVYGAAWHEATENTEEKMSTKPITEIRIGPVKAAVWQNINQNGVRHKVIVERLYRDGEEWKTRTSFGRDDLLPLAKLADQAHSWILNEDADVKVFVREIKSEGALPT